ncbi:MAG: hypothetical protein JWO37_1768 [Acidimicrobiales bacterium]|jgi:hypothetical protein|nr:hypothetical protein [Acidimicrobiales bacterium]
MTEPQDAGDPPSSAALTSIAASLRADGYRMHVSEPQPSRVRVMVEALPDACEECLVPKAIMTSIIESALEGAGIAPSVVELLYPGERAEVADA